MLTSQSPGVQSLFTAMHAFQGEITEPKKDSKNAHIGNKYASLATVRAHCQPLLTKHGLGVTQLPYSEEGRPGVTTVLFHADSGQWIQTSIAMDTYTQKGANSAQIVGSILTYLRRYSWLAILGLSSEDDDASSVSDAPPQERQAPRENYSNAAHAAGYDTWRDVLRSYIRGPLREATGETYTASKVDSLCENLVGCKFAGLDEPKGVKVMKYLEEKVAVCRRMELRDLEKDLEEGALNG